MFKKMLSDAKRFIKALNYVETNVVAPSVCVKFSSVGDSQLTVLVIQKISTPVEKLCIVYRFDFGVPRLLLI